MKDVKDVKTDTTVDIDLQNFNAVIEKERSLLPFFAEYQDGSLSADMLLSLCGLEEHVFGDTRTLVMLGMEGILGRLTDSADNDTTKEIVMKLMEKKKPQIRIKSVSKKVAEFILSCRPPDNEISYRYEGSGDSFSYGEVDGTLNLDQYSQRRLDDIFYDLLELIGANFNDEGSNGKMEFNFDSGLFNVCHKDIYESSFSVSDYILVLMIREDDDTDDTDDNDGWR